MSSTKKHGFRYAWTITKDFIDEGLLEGTTGPRTATAGKDYITRHGKAFRMLDDDGEVYCHGRICGDDFEGFEPLDDFGEPGLGCTTIQYRESGRWTTL